MDKIIKIGNSILQHGKENDRVYLMSLDLKDTELIQEEINKLILTNKYTKVFAKVDKKVEELFSQQGYAREAIVPELFGNGKDGVFLAKYFSDERKVDEHFELCQKVLQTAINKKKAEKSNVSISKLPKGYTFRKVVPEDAVEVSILYQTVFQTYPFPVHEAEYILQTMKDNVIYFGIWHETKLVALSSIEAADKYKNAEMTDFAVLEEYQGKDFALLLLNEMEKCLKEMNYQTAYTIARAKSYGMNITFAKSGYTYAGTLTNNTQISGNIESMNVWYKTVM
ncbi:MAG: putative beta-lysine N-acetyltransferase [Lachnotalea sp.]